MLEEVIRLVHECERRSPIVLSLEQVQGLPAGMVIRKPAVAALVLPTSWRAQKGELRHVRCILRRSTRQGTPLCEAGNRVFEVLGGGVDSTEERLLTERRPDRAESAFYALQVHSLLLTGALASLTYDMQESHLQALLRELAEEGLVNGVVPDSVRRLDLVREIPLRFSPYNADLRELLERAGHGALYEDVPTAAQVIVQYLFLVEVDETRLQVAPGEELISFSGEEVLALGRVAAGLTSRTELPVALRDVALRNAVPLLSFEALLRLCIQEGASWRW